jgi:hypothetical protein
MIKEMVKGVRCGNHGREGRFYHESADEVRNCYAWTWDNEEAARAEQAVELAYERYLEDPSYGANAAADEYFERQRRPF